MISFEPLARAPSPSSLGLAVISSVKQEKKRKQITRQVLAEQWQSHYFGECISRARHHTTARAAAFYDEIRPRERRGRRSAKVSATPRENRQSTIRGSIQIAHALPYKAVTYEIRVCLNNATTKTRCCCSRRYIYLLSSVKCKCRRDECRQISKCSR